MTKAEQTIDLEMTDNQLELLNNTFIGTEHIKDAMMAHAIEFAEWLRENPEIRNEFANELKTTKEFYQIFNYSE